MPEYVENYNNMSPKIDVYKGSIWYFIERGVVRAKARYAIMAAMPPRVEGNRPYLPGTLPFRMLLPTCKCHAFH